MLYQCGQQVSEPVSLGPALEHIAVQESSLECGDLAAMIAAEPAADRYTEPQHSDFAGHILDLREVVSTGFEAVGEIEPVGHVASD